MEASANSILEGRVGDPSMRRRSGGQHRATQKVENGKDYGYLKMAPCDSPSKIDLETNLSGLITKVCSLNYIYGNLLL